MLAIIPARAGSKGLPGKNIKLLHGKPLIAYTIQAAVSSENISRIIISTDSKEIAEVAVSYGAECPFMRPQYLADDNSRSIDVYQHVIEELEKRDGIFINEFIVLQPTSPFRTAEDIDNAINLFKNKNADSVISYCEEHHPIKWHKYIDKNGRFENLFENVASNRQLERTSYFPNGAIYILKRNLIESNNYYTENSFAYMMDKTKSVDIDTIDDFNFAEFLLATK
ncbi:cytidylyltransferase domain-containing protein [Pedobacter sp. V48]|uniref:acylneuraminate cytidylyltransferase family protein n=1 Tax=Pedobacter sp. V48 TaxID=509635 RepID=UPI0004AE2519|nr:acylneuraminate cytidylyltransferase family protein [Pedobacter sp. V48]